MKIIACIKQVPDSEAKVKAEDGKVTWGDAPLVINPFDEYAVEGALQQREALGGTVTALCIGPESAKDALKHALAMGADEAVLVSDPALTELRYRRRGARAGGCHQQDRRRRHGHVRTPNSRQRRRAHRPRRPPESSGCPCLGSWV